MRHTARLADVLWTPSLECPQQVLLNTRRSLHKPQVRSFEKHFNLDAVVCQILLAVWLQCNKPHNEYRISSAGLGQMKSREAACLASLSAISFLEFHSEQEPY